MDRDDSHTPPDAAGEWQRKSHDADAPDGSQPQHGKSQGTDDAKADASRTDSLPAPDDAASDALVMDDGSVSWTASEFIAHEKGVTWYGGLALATVIVTAVIYFLTQDKITSGVVVFAAIVFGVYGARKPRTLEYRLGTAGLTIAGKFYDYGQFRSFWTLKEGAFQSITFMPLKRFMPSLTIYYSPQDEQRIMQVLEQCLPMENRDRDLLERFLHRIRF